MKKLSILLILILLVGCAPAKFQAFKPEPFDLPNKPEKYSVSEDLKNLDKPTKIIARGAKLIDDHLVFVDEGQGAEFIVLAPEEFNKINKLRKLCSTYKAVIYKQEELVNLRNQIVSSQLDLIRLLERERDIAISAWENSENSFRQEYADHKRDNFINKTGSYIITVGSIILLATGL